MRSRAPAPPASIGTGLRRLGRFLDAGAPDRLGAVRRLSIALVLLSACLKKGDVDVREDLPWDTYADKQTVARLVDLPPEASIDRVHHYGDNGTRFSNALIFDLPATRTPQQWLVSIARQSRWERFRLMCYQDSTNGMVDVEPGSMDAFESRRWEIWRTDATGTAADARIVIDGPSRTSYSLIWRDATPTEKP